MRGFLRETVVELVMSKAIWLYVAVTILVCAFLLSTGQSFIKIDINGNGASSGIGVKALSQFCAFLGFLMIVGSSGVFPRMLRKGTIDFYLARPLPRGKLLFLKFLSVYLVYSFFMLVAGTLFWICWSTATHDTNFVSLGVVVIHLFLLLLWMSVAVAAAIVGRSQGIAIMTVMVIWVLQSVLLQSRLAFSQIPDGYDGFPPPWLRVFVEISYQILPKANELTTSVENALLGNGSFAFTPLLTTSAFLVAVFALTHFLFRRADY